MIIHHNGDGREHPELCLAFHWVKLDPKRLLLVGPSLACLAETARNHGKQRAANAEREAKSHLASREHEYQRKLLKLGNVASRQPAVSLCLRQRGLRQEKDVSRPDPAEIP